MWRWLAASDVDGQFAGGYHRCVVLVASGHLARLQGERYGLALSCLQVYPLESLQGAQGNFQAGIVQADVQLYNFVAVALACVGYLYAGPEAVACLQGGGYLQIVVAEGRVA